MLTGLQNYIHLHVHEVDNTVFIRILAVATINFSLAGVRLLIEGGSYSRANFGETPLGDIDTIDSFFKTDFRYSRYTQCMLDK